MFKDQEAFPGKRGTVIVWSAGNQSNLEPKDGTIPFSVPVGAPCNATEECLVHQSQKHVVRIDRLQEGPPPFQGLQTGSPYTKDRNLCQNPKAIHPET
jgi:hypothetical protein